MTTELDSRPEPISYILEVSEVIKETEDALSIVLKVPEELREIFAYAPGQFLTVAVPSDRDGLAGRCYSLSSTPYSGLHQITVKRTADGYASNWLHQNLKSGDTLRVLPPSGTFTLQHLDEDLLLFAAGSGITPVMSIARTALEKGIGRVVLFYANQDERSVIFASALRGLAEKYAERFLVIHWLESVQGLPNQAHLHAVAKQFATYTTFLCGPAPFMKAATDALRVLGVPRARRHRENFITLDGNPFGDVDEVLAARQLSAKAEEDDGGGDDSGTAKVDGPVTVEVEINGEQHNFEDWHGNQVLLEYLEAKGIDAPFSCREGQCSACACVVLEVDVIMKHNEVLDDEDLADGIRLVCQSLPASRKLKITY